MPSNLIGSLRVALGLDSAKFEKGAKRASGAGRKLARSLKRISVVGAAVGVAVAGASTVLAKAARENIDQNAKLAQSVGTTVGSIQTINRAAELAGVSSSEAAEGIARLTRRISLAAQGTGPAADAFERLGLDLEKLQNLPVDERIIRINEAIEDTIPELERAGVLSQIFGDRAFAAFQRLDPETLRTARAELEAYGVIVSDIDAEKIERANDALSQLGLIAKGLGNRIAVFIAPFLEQFAGVARVIATETGPAFERLAEIGIAAWNDIGEGVSVLTKRFRAVAVDISAVWVNLLVVLSERWEKFLRVVANDVGRLPFSGGIASRLTESANAAGGTLLGLRAEADGLAQTSSRLRKEAAELAEAGFDQTAEAAARLRELFVENGLAAAEAREAMSQLDEVSSDLGDTLNETVSTGARRASEAIKEQSKELTEAEKRAADLKSQMASTFSSIITGSESARDALSRLGQSIASNLVERGVTSLLTNIIPGFATGTRFAPGGVSLVGERGPELVNLPRGSQVFDAGRTRSMLSGSGTSIVINVDAKGAQDGVGAQVAAAITKLLPELDRRIVQRVQAGSARGEI